MFEVSGDAYDRFMGRFSIRLGPVFADFAGVERGMRVLDVGCGPGALTSELVRRVGPDHVAAVDPSASFVAVTRERLPGVDVRQGPAEELPWETDTFDAALSQLVVSFMRDAVAGVREMRRVTLPGGVVAACMWDPGGEMQLLDVVHGAAVTIDPEHPAARGPRRYRTAPELRELFEQAGLAEVETSPLDVEAGYEGFDDFWNAVLAGAGPVGELLKTLDDEQIAAFQAECRRRLGDPQGPFTLSGRAWAVRGRA